MKSFYHPHAHYSECSRIVRGPQTFGICGRCFPRFMCTYLGVLVTRTVVFFLSGSPYLEKLPCSVTAVSVPHFARPCGCRHCSFTNQLFGSWVWVLGSYAGLSGLGLVGCALWGGFFYAAFCLALVPWLLKSFYHPHAHYSECSRIVRGPQTFGICGRCFPRFMCTYLGVLVTRTVVFFLSGSPYLEKLPCSVTAVSVPHFARPCGCRHCSFTNQLFGSWVWVLGSYAGLSGLGLVGCALWGGFFYAAFCLALVPWLLKRYSQGLHPKEYLLIKCSAPLRHKPL